MSILSSTSEEFNLTVEDVPKDKRKYLVIAIHQYKPVFTGFFACLFLLLSVLRIISESFFLISLGLVLLTIILILTGERNNYRRVKLKED